MDKQFSLRKPCANCPFRNDNASIQLQPGRREEIIENLLSGEHQTFSCHKTVHRKDGRNYDEDGNYTPVDVAHCPGAIAVARKFGRDTVLVQVATRLGEIAQDHYDDAMACTIEPESLAIDPRKAHI